MRRRLLAKNTTTGLGCDAMMLKLSEQGAEQLYIAPIIGI